MDKILRIAIDGPSGAGKSTMAKILATKLDIDYIDTGAMYRAIALKLFRTNTDCNNDEALNAMLATTDVDYSKGCVYLDGEDVSGLIRTQEVSEMASVSSAKAQVREKLVSLQMAMAKRKSLVMDGRDIGSKVIPDAEIKFYMVASARVRAERRALENKEKGLPCDVDQIEKDIETRDYRDSHRENSPLVKVSDAIEIDSTLMTIDEVVAKMMSEVEKALA